MAKIIRMPVTTSTSDGQFFHAGGHGEAIGAVNARHGNESGVTFYTHVSDQFGPFYAKVIAATGGGSNCRELLPRRTVASAVERCASEMGGIDGVVTAAGVTHRGSVLQVSAAEWRRVIDINLVGTYIVVHCCLPWLAKAPGAAVVTIGSGQGLLPNIPNRTAYAASKGGVVNLTRALAAQFAPVVRTNCVCPGLVNTPMAAGLQGNVGNYALGRLAEPLEIAHAILFLTGPESTYVTGSTLAVDGGRTFH